MPGTKKAQEPAEGATGSFFLAPAKLIVMIMAAIATMDGLVWILVPGFAASTAYDVATDIAPQTVWGYAMSLSGALGMAAMQLDGKSIAPELGRLALTLYGLITFVVGLSIFYLTFTGAQSALTGATKWWTCSIICLLTLAGPRLTTTHPQSMTSFLGFNRKKRT